jgi:hypothetical protein
VGSKKMKCVIAQMRTGSTMYAEMISSGEDHHLLYELGQQNLHGTQIPNRELFEFYYNSINVINKRFDQFKQMDQKPTIKIIPGLVPTHIVNWCVDNLDCVFLDRKDKWQQILSYGVAKYSSWWFNQSSEDIPLSSMEYLKPDFDYLQSTISEFYKLSHQHQHIPLVFYEDIIIDHNPLIPPKNKQSGLELFSNKDQLQEWYYGFVL